MNSLPTPLVLLMSGSCRKDSTISAGAKTDCLGLFSFPGGGEDTSNPRKAGTLRPEVVTVPAKGGGFAHGGGGAGAAHGGAVAGNDGKQTRHTSQHPLLGR